MQWTKEQEQAIYEDGKDILVAAAAGSGKTAVLVERIIQKMLRETNPYNIDEMLVVTFTNAAAQEMRTRVGLAIEKALEQNPQSVHLKKQLSLIQRAYISTLHAFCMEVVRKYSYKIDLDPSFRILDDIEADLLKNDCIEEVFEEWYGKEGEEQEAFFRFVDSFSSDRDDAKVETLVLKMHEFAMQNPWPYEWLDDIKERYSIDDTTTIDDLVWTKIAKTNVKEELEAIIFQIKQAIDLSEDVGGPYHYTDTLKLDLEQVESIVNVIGAPWNELREVFQDNLKFARLSGKKADCDPELRETVRTIRDRYKKKLTDLFERWFSRSGESLLTDIEKLKPYIDILVELVKQFGETFKARKKEEAVVDFLDLEHYCLDILLSEEATVDEPLPSEVAIQFQNQFKEVLIDEYQDTNLVQETILSLITQDNGFGNLFMVGDVKQSIYRFRHAEPSLFMSKYKTFNEPESNQLRIDLANNFRSRKEVLDATNFVFRQLLDEDVGEMNYDPDSELIYSNKVYDSLTSTEVDTELHLITTDDLEEDEHQSDEWKYLEKAQLEARAYGKKIQSWVGTDDSAPFKVIDKETGKPRHCQYRDIVILLRSMNEANVIEEELKKLGIPVYAELSTGYLKAIEVQVMLNVLKTIDNPQQDIPLASVLRSPIVGLTEDDLVQIRLFGKNEPFYVALNNYIQKGEDADLVDKLNQFIFYLNEWREEAKYGALSQLIWKIYRDTGYFEFVGGIPGGKQRQANLRALYDRARQYENSAYRGLYRFLRFIDRMEEREKDLASARALGEQEDVVRIMTIHKSKGLEFPIVILGFADKQFNEQDFRNQYLLHKNYGFGTKYLDVDKRIMYTTLPFEALKVQSKKEMLAEEMRVLYVALTRAKEKLCIIGTVGDFEDRLMKWNEVAHHTEWVLPPHVRTEQATYLNWIGQALVRHHQASQLHKQPLAQTIPKTITHDESKWKIVAEHAKAYENPEFVTVERNDTLEKIIKNWDATSLQKSDQYDEVNKRLTFHYPNLNSAYKRAKQSVTEIKRMNEVRDEYSSSDLLTFKPKTDFKRPNFMQQQTSALTKAEIGSAVHTVMQHIDFKKDYDEASIKELLIQLVDEEFINEQEMNAIDINPILTFLQSDLGQRVKNAKRVMRELPFTMKLLAQDVYPDWEDESEEYVLIQGVIDCLIEEEEGFSLIDYKTDTLYGQVDKDELKERYLTQITLYKQAVEEIWQIDLNSSYLYYFDRDLVVEI